MILLLLSFFLDSYLSNFIPAIYCSFYLAFLTVLFYRYSFRVFFKQGLLFTILGCLLFGHSVFVRIITFLIVSYILTFFKKRYSFHLGTYLMAVLSIYLCSYFLIYFMSLFVLDIHFTYFVFQ